MIVYHVGQTDEIYDVAILSGNAELNRIYQSTETICKAVCGIVELQASSQDP